MLLIVCTSILNQELRNASRIVSQNFAKTVKWGAYSRWSFGPNFASGSIETRVKPLSGIQILDFNSYVLILPNLLKEEIHKDVVVTGEYEITESPNHKVRYDPYDMGHVDMDQMPKSWNLP